MNEQTIPVIVFSETIVTNVEKAVQISIDLSDIVQDKQARDVNINNVSYHAECSNAIFTFNVSFSTYEEN